MSVIHSEFKFQDVSVDSETMTFSGYGAVFNNIDSYGDLIKPGAFANTLSEARSTNSWPSMLLQHGGWGMSADDMTPIGIWTDMAEDGHGLKLTGKLADTPRGKEIYTLMKMEPRPAIDGLSIGYIPIKFSKRNKPEDPRRTLEEVKLLEVSPVTFPANELARVHSVKSLEEIESPADIESFLREVGGFSKSEARIIIAKSKATSRREAADDSVKLAATLMRNKLILRS